MTPVILQDLFTHTIRPNNPVDDGGVVGGGSGARKKRQRAELSDSVTVAFCDELRKRVE